MRRAREEAGDVIPEEEHELKRVKLQSQSEASNSDERKTCPYLGTINRHVLDFDFEKLCSVTLSNQRPYGCLVCGKFFQGTWNKYDVHINLVRLWQRHG